MSLLYSSSNFDKQQQQHNFWPHIAVAERATARERDRLSARWVKASTDMEAKRRLYEISTVLCVRGTKTHLPVRFLSASLETSAWNGERDR